MWLWLTFYSTNDDDALRLKVEEAMNVYDEYVKNNPGAAGGPDDTGAAQTNGGTENMQPGHDETKDGGEA